MEHMYLNHPFCNMHRNLHIMALREGKKYLIPASCDVLFMISKFLAIMLCVCDLRYVCVAMTS
jgi:hypothetical protein